MWEAYFSTLTPCYSGPAALRFDGQLLVTISPEVRLKQTSLLWGTVLTYTEPCAPADISNQHIHHRAVTFPEVSDGRGCFYYLTHRAELKAHHSHLKPELNLRRRHGCASSVSWIASDLLFCVDCTYRTSAKLDCTFVHSFCQKGSNYVNSLPFTLWCRVVTVAAKRRFALEWLSLQDDEELIFLALMRKTRLWPAASCETDKSQFSWWSRNLRGS